MFEKLRKETTVNIVEKIKSLVEPILISNNARLYDLEFNAGLLIATLAYEEVLLFKRSNKVSSPGKWSIPGGGRKSDNIYELSVETALRETNEEAGHVPKGLLLPDYFIYKDPINKRLYKTHVMEVSKQERNNYLPKLNWEHDSWRWFKIDELKHRDDIHPGVRHVFNKIDPRGNITISYI